MTIKEIKKLYNQGNEAVERIRLCLTEIQDSSIHSDWMATASIASTLTAEAKKMDKIRESLGLTHSETDREWLLHWLDADEETFIRKVIMMEENTRGMEEGVKALFG